LVSDFKEGTYRLRKFENWALRIFGPKWDEVTEGQRKLYNSSPSIIKVLQKQK
jgi:hypothetical protein